MKWTEQIFATLRGWFQLGEDSTDSEIHAAMSQVESLEVLRTNIRTEVTASVQAQVDTLNAEVTSLQSGLAETTRQHEALIASNAATVAELETARARVAELEALQVETHTKVKSSGAGAGNEKAADMPAWEQVKAQFGL